MFCLTLQHVLVCRVLTMGSEYVANGSHKVDRLYK